LLHGVKIKYEAVPEEALLECRQLVKDLEE
jgi:hypothetical protein